MAGSPDLASNLGERLKSSPALLAGIGLVVLAGAGFGVKLVLDRSHVQAPAPVAVASAMPASPAPAAPVAGAPTADSPTRAVSSGENGAPVVTAVTSEPVTSGSEPVHMDDHLTYQYNALGRRDPFQSLVDGEFVGADVGGDAPPDIGGIKVVGVVWGATDQFALIEDVRGNSFVLRKGDKVQNGYVEGLKRDGVIVNLTAEGQSQTVVIPLVRKGDSNVR